MLLLLAVAATAIVGAPASPELALLLLDKLPWSCCAAPSADMLLFMSDGSCTTAAGVLHHA
jgi:hypothetical protein